MGRCVEGLADKTCGRNGVLCDDCTPAGRCSQNACVPRCTVDTCSGCCDALGDCQPGGAASACGSQGASCADCSAIGGTCFLGLCVGGGGVGGGSGTGGGSGGATGGGTGGGSGAGGATGGGTGGSVGGGTGGGASMGAQAFVVFTTSAQVFPNFGGVTGGDRVCQNFARDAGLQGVFIAWLSAPDAGAVSHFPPGLDARWSLLADAGRAFDGPAQLRTSPNLALNRDERGAVRADAVWTGTNTGGNPNANTCANWSSLAVTGSVGSSTNALNWTQGGTGTCAVARRLYCFQVQ